MPNSDHRPKVTIEALLRLKRAERPTAEFWANFERELRQKQLTALLEKNPWWHDLWQLMGRRTYLPLGATAVLAFTLVSVKYYTPQSAAQVGNPAHGSAVAMEQAIAMPASGMLAAPVSSPLINRKDEVLPQSNELTTSTGIADLAPVMLESLPSESPSARSIAANLAHLEQSQPELMNTVLGSRLSASPRIQTASAPVTELAAFSANASKRSRLLANYTERQLNPVPTAPDVIRERLSRRLGDAEYAERFNRIGLKGDQVSLGFTIKL